MLTANIQNGKTTFEVLNGRTVLPFIPVELNDRDRRRRDEWLREMHNNSASSSILVGEDNVTLREVHRWLLGEIQVKR